LVAGSNPARPTTNLAVSIEGVTSDRGAFFVLAYQEPMSASFARDHSNFCRIQFVPLS
jgi:hypothetical protein